MDPRDAALVASETAAKTVAENPGVTLQPGTVVAIEDIDISQYIIASVLVDGDDTGNTTQVTSLIGEVTIGARVMVMFAPPHGVYLIGVLFGDCDVDSITFTAAGTPSADLSPPWPPEVDSYVVEIVTLANTAGTTDTVVHIFVDAVEHLVYTFSSGLTSLILGPEDGADFEMPEDIPVTVQIEPGSDVADMTVTIRWCKGSGRVETEEPGGG